MSPQDTLPYQERRLGAFVVSFLIVVILEQALESRPPRQVEKGLDMSTDSVGTGAELDRILSDLLKLACQSNAAEVGFVALAEAGTGDLVIKYTFGTTHKYLVAGTRVTSGKGIAGWTLAHRQTALVTDVASDPRFALNGSKDLDFVPRDLVCVPLITRDRVIGVFMLLNKKAGTFTEADARLMESVGSLAATAMENASLYRAENRSRRFAQTLSSASMAMAQSQDVSVVLGVLLDYLGRLVPYDRAAAMLVAGSSSLAIRAIRGGSGEEILDPGSLSMVDASAVPVLRAILEEQKAKMVRDTQADPAWAGYPGSEGARSWMGVPLVANGRVIGIYFLVKNKSGFYGEEHLEIVEAMASQATAAVQSAWLFEKVIEGRSRLQSLSRQLVEAQENERRAVARELHDEAGQSLAALKLDLHLLEAKAGDPAAVRAAAAALKGKVEDVIVALHQLASNLRPASLDHVGLEAAVRQMVDAFNHQQGPRMEFEGSRLGAVRLPEFTETQLYRIIHEALTNVMHHSRATAVSVLLERRDGQILAIIEDDGIGFDPILTLHSGRLGLVGMRERAEMLGGKLIIESSEGKGTTVVAEVPDAHPDTAR
jgi:signal transduction histidine kinase